TRFSRDWSSDVCSSDLWGAILIGFNALLWIFLPFYLRKGFYTVPEFLHHRFGTSARTVYSILILLTYILVEIGGVLYLGALALRSEERRVGKECMPWMA